MAIHAQQRQKSPIIAVPTYVDLEQLRTEAKAKAPKRTDASVLKDYRVEREAKPDAEGDPVFVISTSDLDRDNDRVRQQGIRLEQYNANPVILYAHDYYGLPCAKAKRTWIGEDGKLRSIPVFPTAEQSAFGHEVGQLVAGGFLNSASIGFIVHAYELDDQLLEAEGKVGFVFTDTELLEWSICPVPCNPNALREAKGQGIRLEQIGRWAQRTLEETRGEGFWISRDSLEAAIKACLPATTFSLPPAPPASTVAPGAAAPAAPTLDAKQLADQVGAAVDGAIAKLTGSTR